MLAVISGKLGVWAVRPMPKERKYASVSIWNHLKMMGSTRVLSSANVDKAASTRGHLLRPNERKSWVNGWTGPRTTSKKCTLAAFPAGTPLMVRGPPLSGKSPAPSRMGQRVLLSFGQIGKLYLLCDGPIWWIETHM